MFVTLCEQSRANNPFRVHQDWYMEESSPYIKSSEVDGHLEWSNPIGKTGGQWSDIELF